MGGMALGSWLGGLFASRLRRPVVAYAICEIGIAAFCSLSPGFEQPLRSAYVALAADQGAGARLALQLLLSAGALLPPTILMGMTMPLLTRALLAHSRSLGQSAGLLYGANTLGAALGAVVAGYLALPELGVTSTTFVAVLGNLAAALLGLLLVARSRGLVPPAGPEETATLPGEAPSLADRRLGLAALCVLTAGGAVTFALETANVHLLAVVAGNSAYAFSLMLFAFLLGLGGGSAIGRRLIARGADLASGLSLCESMVALSLFLTVFRWDGLSVYFSTFDNWQPASSFAAREVIRFSVCLSTMLAPALCIGAAYPFAMEAVGRAFPANKVRALGTATALNTLGNVSGALLGGFWLLPGAGSLRTIHVLAAIALALSILPAVVASGARRLTLAAAASAAVLIAFALQPRAFDWTRIASGTNVYFGPATWGTAIDVAESLDGGVTTVNQVQNKNGTRTHVLLTNGKFQGNDSVGGEMVPQVGFALDPLLHTTRRGRALNIGFGTGTTARILQEAEFATVEVVELSADILRLADRWFRPVNGGVLSRPRVRPVVADGRNFLLLSKDSYDLVSIEVTSIWFAGAGALYNREFYSLVKSRLAPGGVLQQWVQLHHISPRNVATVLETVRSEFPEVWLYQNDVQGVIVACLQRCPPTEQALALLESGPALGATLAGLHLSPRSLAAGLVLDPRGTDAFLEQMRSVAPGGISTDDNLLLEYGTPSGNVLPGNESAAVNLRLLAPFSAGRRR
jgi:spermidine synthase